MARILLVDDDRAVLSSFERTFSRAGHEVTATGDALNGLDAYRAERPDVVFCDVFMPGMKGAELVIEIKKVDPDARIVMISGGGLFTPGDVLDSLDDLGIDHAVRKPCESQELLDVLDQVIGRDRSAAPVS